MKKVLVTGADGFIGSHLTELLLSEGYAVRALSQYNSFNNWGGSRISSIRHLKWCVAMCATRISADIYLRM